MVTKQEDFFKMQEDIQSQVTKLYEQTLREQIAHSIRLFTYRELMQISTELSQQTVSENAVEIANMLDSWAHMVEEETSVRKKEK